MDSFCRKMMWIQLLLPLVFMVTVSSQNTAPEFASNMTSAFIPEDTPLGKCVFWIVARDADNDPLTYSMEGQDSYYFNVNLMTGEVQLALPLDYESKNKLNTMIKVQDEINRPVIRQFPVIVEDRNDNDPVFLGIPYEASIREDQPLGSIVFSVSAVDFDDDGRVPVTYSIDEIIPNDLQSNNLFYILLNGSIILNDTLNYNEKSIFYQMTINATDKGGLFHNHFMYRSTLAYVSLKVIDLPDLDPQFINAPYSVSIEENIALGTTIFRVTAIDGDRGINDEIQYSIQDSSRHGLFDINSKSGEIFVTAKIDREALVQDGEQVLLTVMAQEKNLNVNAEKATSTTTVTVRVLDINDNKPNFYNCEIDDCDFSAAPTLSFLGEIEEHSSIRVPVAKLKITGHDPDKDKNGNFNLYLRGKDQDCFTVSPARVQNTGLIQVLVKDSVAIDYEKVHQMEVEIVANDTGLQDCCSYATVTIDIIDINDHTPEFSQDTYYLEVMENCPDGTQIGTITATDLDSGELGKITYQLLPESIRQIFHVDSDSGEIIAVNGNLLDRERRSLYYATLQAADGLNATGTALLEITILDENDEIPTAIGSYNIFVNENTDDVRIQIEAFDADEPNTNNSRIEFELLPSVLSSNFSVNVTTGLITSIGPLDREAIDEKDNGCIVLTVKLYDLGVPSLSSEVNVTINVEDLNDNVPVFSKTVYDFFVNESTIAAQVGILLVSDQDQTELNNRVSFRISQGGSGNFIIRNQKVESGLYNGILSLDPDVMLDYETQKNYTLIIEAQDNGLHGVSHTATATASVQVLDLNDEPPYVDPSSLNNLFLLENRTVGLELLTTLKAHDPDTIHELEFQALSLQCFKNGNDIGNICYDWIWLAPNGELFVNDTEVVDYELCDVMVMMLRVEDKLTLIGDRYSKNESLRVDILDVNDNAPEFLDVDEVFVVVPDVAPIDYQVALVKATDKDSGLNAVLKFSIASVEFISGDSTRPLLNIFTIVTTSEKEIYQGSIRVASSLDATLKGNYRVTVIAEDSGNPSLTATRVLDIFAVDESYRVTLKFSKTADEVRETSEEIKRALTMATKATVYVAQIKDLEPSSKMIIQRASAECIMSVYFVYNNGTAITPEELERILQSDSAALAELLQLGLFVIGGGAGINKKANEILYGVIAGLAGALVLILIIMIIALVCVRKSHKRQLRAVKALKVAKTLPVEMVQGVEAIPGTNKFNSDGANPMLNLDVNPILDLGFEESSSFSDSASVNSLDDNMLARNGGQSSVPQESQDMSVLSGTDEDSRAKEEPLAAALSGRAQTSYSNGALDTTDL
ncbi:hypothetical protein XENTR_v10008358 [Xenopus tropicalis]|uniref:Cadherin-related family member 2 n=2 Tax=Xenopus tropicalis TaxID=8364 RepID=A0A8J1JDJ4_XENTR|nr:cadherin-related family member 2 isoform X1 [Xenopus tropicalis]KAE8614939.1 hypothetical protein XENTR_v10008358 [Xenopus tropicalis]KAE8614940.1 hypothetical protein XENTR_v10008358 [Xenopus tropicalis]KAE8614941.1 hypothetical protein XENTR_v10008358 [Xenopus tropicalis]